jgi:nicotinate-nucleotide adenylyltransferase
MALKVGVIGGTFNPIHNGHLRLAEVMLEAEKFDNIIFVPSFNPPLKDQDIVSFDQRVSMLQLAIEDNPSFVISTIEQDLLGKSYTFNMLQKLIEESPSVEFTFILGAECWNQMKSWYKPIETLGLCDFLFVCDSERRCAGDIAWSEGDPMVRQALGVVHNNKKEFVHPSGTRVRFEVHPTPKIRSTEIRWICAKGKSCRYLLPESVYKYILQHRLYNLSQKF